MKLKFFILFLLIYSQKFSAMIDQNLQNSARQDMSWAQDWINTLNEQILLLKIHYNLAPYWKKPGIANQIALLKVSRANAQAELDKNRVLWAMPSDTHIVMTHCY